MAVLRFLASLFMLVAVVALVADATVPLSGAGPFKATSFAKHWADIAPVTYKAAQTAVSNRAAPWVWDPLILSIISLPTFVLFGLLALLAGYGGRRRASISIDRN
jgi:hypothetical protein